MWLRHQFDLSPSDLWAGFSGLFTTRSAADLTAALEQTWSTTDRCLITLSVRSAFDLLLRSLALSPGDEILYTALTVPGMVEIASAHGLRPVPVAVDGFGQIDVADFHAALSPRTRLFVIAHLFGGVTDFSELVPELQRRNVLIVEDSAQYLPAIGATGHPASDVVLFSFGPIKTATALGGGLAIVGDPTLHARMAEQLQTDPQQSRVRFLRRWLQFAILYGLAQRRCAALWFPLAVRCGFDVDRRLNACGRGFADRDLLSQLRQRPSLPLLHFLLYRWRTYDFSMVATRIHLGRRFDARLGRVHSPAHTYWVYPVCVEQGADICARLQVVGFDATTRSRMTCVTGRDSPALQATRARWQQVVFLPWSPDLPETEIDRLAAALTSACDTAGH